MADAGLLSLLLKIEGGDASAAEVAKVRQALQGVEEENNKLDGKFQKQFTHVGLKAFLKDATHAMGIGGALKPMVSSLSAGFESLADKVGIAGTKAGLIAAALIMVAGLMYKVSQHADEVAKKHEELAKKQEEALKTTRELGEAFKAYREEVGPLPAHLERLAAANERLEKVQRLIVQQNQGKELAGIAAKRIANKGEQQDTEDLIKQLERNMAQHDRRSNQYKSELNLLNAYKDKLNELKGTEAALSQSEEKGKADILARGAGAADAADQTKKLTEEHKKQREELEKLSQEEDAYFEKLFQEHERETDSFIASVDATTKAQGDLNQKRKILADEQYEATDNALQKENAAIKKFYDEQKRSIEEVSRKGIEAADGDAQTIIAIEQNKARTLSQLDATVQAKRRMVQTEYQQMVVSGARTTAQAIGNAGAQMLVDGKNVEEALVAMSKQVASQIIADLIRIQIQAKLTKMALSLFSFGGTDAVAAASAGAAGTAADSAGAADVAGGVA